jgi:hypothetical protein
MLFATASFSVSALITCIVVLAQPQGSLVVGAATATKQNVDGRRSNSRPQERKVMAWATGSNPLAAKQLRNSTWSGVFDGVQAFCGASFRSDGLGIEIDDASWENCKDLYQAVKDAGAEFHLVLGNVPDVVVSNPQPAIDSAIKLAKDLGLDGWSLDDEYDCAPRSTVDRFRDWIHFVDLLSDGLHSHGLVLSAAVQAMFGIQDIPYRPNCGPNKTAADCSQACDRLPSQYPLQPAVTELMSNSKIDQWLVMDTYYFTTARFLDALDWYTENVSNDQLGMAMMNRDDITEDGLLARFYAIHKKSEMNWINIFLLPADDMFLYYLKRWKSYCNGCGVQSSLGCFDLTVPCNGSLRDVTVDKDTM